jgi:uncharacterized protein (TIGR02594 family)
MPDLLAMLTTGAPWAIPKWGQIALRYDGVHEIPGAKDNPELMKLLDMADGVANGHTVGANNDDEAWCAKGMSAVYELAGIRSARTARARNYLGWGVKLPAPAFWCTAVLERGPDMGHVTFPIGRTAEGNLVGFGANQGDSWKPSVFDIKRVLGYRYPAGQPLPNPIDFTLLPLLKLEGGKLSRDER